MRLFSKKDKSSDLIPEPAPRISAADLANATAMMDRWDRGMGDNAAMWDCLEAIAVLGGFRGIEATLMEVMDGKDPGDVTNRPWRWWAEASRVALEDGDAILPARIFLFSWLFVNQMVPTMNAATQADVGLGGPDEPSYQSIAHQAIRAMGALSPSLVIHDTSTGKVDVANALRLAHAVTGTTPTARPAQTEPTRSSSLDASRWNSY